MSPARATKRLAAVFLPGEAQRNVHYRATQIRTVAPSGTAITLPVFTQRLFELALPCRSFLHSELMETLTKTEIESALSSRLSNCVVTCLINPDGSLSVTVLAPDANQFTIASINRAQYHAESGINRLVREILEEMVVSRQSSHLPPVG